MEKRFDLNAY